MPFDGKPWSSASEGDYDRTCRQPGEDFSSLQIRTCGFLLRKPLESQAMFWALVHAVQAKMALGLMPRHAADRIIASLAAEKTTVAVIAMFRTFDQAKHGPARYDSKQRT